MRKKGLLIAVSIIAMVALFAMTDSAFAAKSKIFILKGIKNGSTALTLSKPVSGKISNVNIAQTAPTRPTITITYATLRNNHTSSTGTITMTLASTTDSRAVTVSGKVKMTVKSSGSKVTKIAPVGLFSYEGTDSAGLPVTGTFTVPSGSFKVSAKNLKIDSNALLGGLLAEGEVGAIGTEVGTYTYSVKVSTGIPQKYRSKTFTTVAGTLTVE